MKITKSENFFNICTSAGVVFMHVDDKGVITDLNSTTLSELGLTEKDVMGKRWEDLLEPESLTGNAEIARNPEHLAGRTEVIGLRGADNHTSYIEFQFFTDPGDGSFVLIGKDVTHFIAEQYQLRSSNALYRRLASSVPDVNMFLFDRYLRFVIAEGNEMKNHGLSPAFFEGKRLADIHDRRLHEIFTPLFKLALEGKEITTEYTYRNNDYLISVFPLEDDTSKVTSGIAITQNITQEKTNADLLYKAKQAAEEANKTKTEFLANISHEIRTPLSAIVGFSEQLLKLDLNKKVREYAEIIEKSSEQLLALVNDLLILSRIEAGRIDFDEENFKISKAVDYVYNAMKAKANDKGIDFRYELGVGIDRVVIGDEFRLSQVLINLVSNAIKFTEKGKVELICTKVRETGNEVFIRFTVKDTGVGIPADKVKIIFEQFRQADSAVTKKYGGTGLGLTISKRLVEMQNGRIEVKSDVGKGTTFSVLLPFGKGDEKDYHKEDFEGEMISFDGKKALVVDDDSVNRLLGQTILFDLGFSVEMAGSGADAIDKLNTGSYDVVILDIHMPGVSGIDVANFIRQSKHDRHTRILAVTAAFLKEDIRKYKVIGIDDYLIKPFREIKLYNKMCKLLGYDLPRPIHKTTHKHRRLVKQPGQLYDLSELKAMAKNDKDFLVSMLDTFIENLEEGIANMKNGAEKEDWKLVGEIAHKLVPSFEHLQVTPVVKSLKFLEKVTLHEPQFEKAGGVLDGIFELADKVKLELAKEKEALLLQAGFH